MKRRSFLQTLASAPAVSVPAMASLPAAAAPENRFKISLAEWSFHRAINSRLITNMDFPRIAREQFGIEGLEFVNQLWEAPIQDYVTRLKRRMNDTGTKGVLLMCDGEGLMGHSDRAVRMKAAQNHRKWVDIAAELGCHAIRTNMYSDLHPKTDAEIETMLGYCSESFHDLCGYSKAAGLSVLIENHGGVSSDPDVVVRLMRKVDLPNFGTLPDFGNFPKEIDRYEAIRKLMAYAKGVSFKCWDFGPDGNETTLDVPRIMKIVRDAGYHGYVGIEYEGQRLSEWEGVAAAKRLLDRINA